jgi:radical SAM protein with 4Fe4S-binding SPASM domain
MFFRLNPEARLVSGAKNGVVYDFLHNKMHDLNSEEKSILELTEKNKEIKEVSAELGIPEPSALAILEKLKERNLGEFYGKKPYIEPLRLKPPLSGRGFYDAPPRMTNLFVELNNECQFHCHYCGNTMKRVFGCIGCNVWDSHKNSLKSDSYISILDQASKLGMRNIFLSGGNVLKDVNMLSAVLDHCETLHFPVFLTCHENYVDLNAINFLNHYRELTIFLNCNFPVSSKALEIAGSVQCNFTLVPVVDVTSMNKKDITKRIQCEYEKVQNICRWQIDYCSAHFTKDYSKIPLFGKQRVKNATLQFFEQCQEHHPCLGGILTVSSDGNVYVCRVMREKPLGNVSDINLSEIIRNNKEETGTFWNLTRDNIYPCNMCEYRYSCMDCRAIEEDMYQTTLCGYNPHTGEWE